ncbi:hypothetical protein BDQ12DRAFT_646333 [Crucibulum laeve]|uniref:RRM domain-containing protein n=1 Tax=Crucibulum laeve TaxID=68775 RepID=A0A5C3MBB3_9AGAR|nr:hypothetical protein BDQ12DRAFT_646333 [Crucibulum laeve]
MFSGLHSVAVNPCRSFVSLKRKSAPSPPEVQIHADPTHYCILVDNITEDTQEDSLLELFSFAGEVISANVYPKPHSGVWGLVRFANAEQATTSVSLFNDYSVNGNVLSVRTYFTTSTSLGIIGENPQACYTAWTSMSEDPLPYLVNAFGNSPPVSLERRSLILAHRNTTGGACWGGYTI